MGVGQPMIPATLLAGYQVSLIRLKQTLSTHVENSRALVQSNVEWFYELMWKF